MVDLGTTKVLVVDDEPSTRAMVARHLRSIGYRVIEAVDGDEALSLALEHLPDVVVLDVMMPGMSGWEVCRRIRETVSLAHTGVVMLTGIGASLNEITSPLYGADAYLDKPFDFAVLNATIAETLEKRHDHVGRLDEADVEIVQTMRELDDDEVAEMPVKPKRIHRAAKSNDVSAQDDAHGPSKRAKKLQPARNVEESLDDFASAENDFDMRIEDEFSADSQEPPAKKPRKSKKASAAKSEPSAWESQAPKVTAAKPKAPRKPKAKKAQTAAKPAKAPKVVAKPTKKAKAAAKKAVVKVAKQVTAKGKGKPTKKAPAKKAPAKKAPAKKAPAKKAPARKRVAIVAKPAKKTAKKAPARKTPARKRVAIVAKPAKKTAKKAPARKTPARKTPARKRVAIVAKPANKTPTRKRAAIVAKSAKKTAKK